MIKLMTVLILTLFTLQSFACGIGGATGGSKLTWDELKQCSELSFMPKMIKIEHKRFTIFNICQTKIYIRSKNPVSTKCDHYGNCTQIYMYKKKVKEELKCKEYRDHQCIYHREELIITPTSFEVKIFKIKKNGILKFLFEKNYTIPLCQS